jgi:geranylgeranyl reductase family protein
LERAGVLIVGGGPAGSACATALARQGRDVLVLDASAFPRDKPCAGWITPEVVSALPLDLEEYGRDHTLQPISRFRIGRIGGGAVDVGYDAPVSYGIRRCEFDTFLLRRSGARVRTGERVKEIRRERGEWVVNGRFAAPVLVGAGGHFCPVSRHLNGAGGEAPLVVAREVEYPLEGEGAARCPVDPERPELYFCADFEGYGWCFRKGRYLNVGLGRRDSRDLRRHTREFVEGLVREGRLKPPPEEGWRGHAYRLRAGRPPRLVADGLLLAGDAAGLAYGASGEGILPAIVSGQLAAETILAAGEDTSAARLTGYLLKLDERLGRRAAGGPSLPAPLAALAGAALLASPWLVRRVVLDRWFLHRETGGRARAATTRRGRGATAGVADARP